MIFFVVRRLHCRRELAGAGVAVYCGALDLTDWSGSRQFASALAGPLRAVHHAGRMLPIAALGLGVACRSDSAVSPEPPSRPTAPAPDTTPCMVEILATGTLNLRRGDTTRISALVKSVAGQVVVATIEWQSYNAAIADISADDLIGARSRSAATIVARESGATARIAVHVAVRPEAVSWDGVATLGTTFRVHGMYLDGSTAAKRSKVGENATALTWKTLLVVEQHFRKLNAPHLCTVVYEDATFRDGIRIITPSPRKLCAA